VGFFQRGGRGQEGPADGDLDAYRAEHPDEFEQIVRWRIADSSTALHNEQARAGARFDLSTTSGT
jgi:hypothetical protein